MTHPSTRTGGSSCCCTHRFTASMKACLSAGILEPVYCGSSNWRKANASEGTCTTFQQQVLAQRKNGSTHTHTRREREAGRERDTHTAYMHTHKHLKYTHHDIQNSYPTTDTITTCTHTYMFLYTHAKTTHTLMYT